VLCLDTKLVYLSGQTPFEPCDLTTAAGASICAKRLGQSSNMTYVFTQAVRACRLLLQVQEARQKLEELIGAADPAKEATTRAVIEALESLGRHPVHSRTSRSHPPGWSAREYPPVPGAAR
jgi:uncharacterized protein (TIGR04141 family)